MSDDPAARVAAEIERRGLAAPARLLADAHRPLAPLLSDLGVAIGPILSAVAGPRGGRLGSFLADQTALDQLLSRLDRAIESDAEPD